MLSARVSVLPPLSLVVDLLLLVTAVAESPKLGLRGLSALMAADLESELESRVVGNLGLDVDMFGFMLPLLVPGLLLRGATELGAA